MPEQAATRPQLHPRARAGTAVATTTAGLRQLLAMPLDRRRQRLGPAPAVATPAPNPDEPDTFSAPLPNPSGGLPSTASGDPSKRSPDAAPGGIPLASTAALSVPTPGEYAGPSGACSADPAGTGRASRAQPPARRPSRVPGPAAASAHPRAAAPESRGAPQSTAEPPDAEHGARFGERPTGPVDAPSVAPAPAMPGGRARIAGTGQAIGAASAHGPAPMPRGQRQAPSARALDDAAVAPSTAQLADMDGADSHASTDPAQGARGLDALAAWVGAGLRRREQREPRPPDVETAECRVARGADPQRGRAAGPMQRATQDALVSATPPSPFTRAPLPGIAPQGQGDAPNPAGFAEDVSVFDAAPDELGLLRDQLLALLRREAELHGIHLWER